MLLYLLMYFSVTFSISSIILSCVRELLLEINSNCFLNEFIDSFPNDRLSFSKYLYRADNFSLSSEIDNLFIRFLSYSTGSLSNFSIIFSLFNNPKFSITNTRVSICFVKFTLFSFCSSFLCPNKLSKILI